MKKVLIFVLFCSYLNAGPVLTHEAIYDGMLSGLNGLVKEITGQNDQLHEENCQKEYKKLYKRNSQLLKDTKEENIKLKKIARMNSIAYEETTINHIEIRQNEKCSIRYYDYFKSTNHEISKLSKENTKLKNMLSKRRINYTPLLKTKSTGYVHKEENVNKSERELAKEDLKRQMGF